MSDIDNNEDYDSLWKEMWKLHMKLHGAAKQAELAGDLEKAKRLKTLSNQRWQEATEYKRLADIQNGVIRNPLSEISSDLADKLSKARRLQSAQSTVKGITSLHGDDVIRHSQDADRYMDKAKRAKIYADKKSKVLKMPTRENFDGGEEYNDEVGMIRNNLHTMMRACKGLHKSLEPNENVPEWVQEKIAAAKGMLVSVWDYMLSQHEEGNIYHQPTSESKKAKKQRLDPKCWKGYRKQGTKVKGGVRVNNCVPVSENLDNLEKTLHLELQKYKYRR